LSTDGWVLSAKEVSSDKKDHEEYREGRVPCMLGDGLRCYSRGTSTRDGDSRVLKQSLLLGERARMPIFFGGRFSESRATEKRGRHSTRFFGKR